MPIKIETLHYRGWVFTLRHPIRPPKRLLLILHGWTGDERSMWRYLRDLPADYDAIAPHAPYPAPKKLGGYSWREIKPGTWGAPTLNELQFSANALVSLVDLRLDSVKTALPVFDIVGFSQGGALAVTIASLHPNRVGKIAVLSGFVPAGVDSLLKPNLLEGKRFFWAHGVQDETIAFERGRAGVALLQNAGAEVAFCQADVGHRVGESCRRELDSFLSN